MSLLGLVVALAVAGSGEGEARLRSALQQNDWDGVRAMGEGVMPVMARMYPASNVVGRIAIAHAFYQLGWKSEEARRALMADVRTDHPTLRVSVQYALGRVSNDDEVVATLLENMRNDPNPYFRDKSACALAYDQPHLTFAQKARLYAALIEALEDPKLDVRRIALQVLHIHTGQTKDFDPAAPPPARQQALSDWQRWLVAFRANVEALSVR